MSSLRFFQVFPNGAVGLAPHERIMQLMSATDELVGSSDPNQVLVKEGTGTKSTFVGKFRYFRYDLDVYAVLGSFPQGPVVLYVFRLHGKFASEADALVAGTEAWIDLARSRCMPSIVAMARFGLIDDVVGIMHHRDQLEDFIKTQSQEHQARENEAKQRLRIELQAASVAHQQLLRQPKEDLFQLNKQIDEACKKYATSFRL